jgi:hypothetical protein
MRTPFRVALWAALALVLAGGLSVAAFSIAAKDVGNAPTEPIGFTPSPLPSRTVSPTVSPHPTRTPTATPTHEPTAQPSGGGSTSTSSAPPASPSPSNDDHVGHEGGDD